jgi:hypothetical protein
VNASDLRGEEEDDIADKPDSESEVDGDEEGLDKALSDEFWMISRG